MKHYQHFSDHKMKHVARHCIHTLSLFLHNAYIYHVCENENVSNVLRMFCGRSAVVDILHASRRTALNRLVRTPAHWGGFATFGPRWRRAASWRRLLSANQSRVYFRNDRLYICSVFCCFWSHCHTRKKSFDKVTDNIVLLRSIDPISISFLSF